MGLLPGIFPQPRRRGLLSPSSMNTILPVLSNVADRFNWKVQATIASNVVPNNKATSQFKTQPDSFFCLMGFQGSTNYDNFSGDLRAVVGAGPAAATRLGTPPRVPNNFEVQIRRGSKNLMDVPIPQAVICGNGYFAGVQCPWPILFAPSTMFYFDLYNVAPTLLNDNAATAINLRIDFGLFGYFVPVENLQTFIAAFPSLRQSILAARGNGQPALSRLTEIKIPGLSA